MGDELIQRRLVLYSASASDKKESLAYEHSRGREIVHGIESMLSKCAERDAYLTTDEKFYVRSFYPPIDPALEIVVVFYIEWPNVHVDKLAFKFL